MSDLVNLGKIKGYISRAIQVPIFENDTSETVGNRIELAVAQFRMHLVSDYIDVRKNGFPDTELYEAEIQRNLGD